MKTALPDRTIVIVDGLSKSVVLARDEREVASVFELVEPFARDLAKKGRVTATRRTILKPDAPSVKDFSVTSLETARAFAE